MVAPATPRRPIPLYVNSVTLQPWRSRRWAMGDEDEDEDEDAEVSQQQQGVKPRGWFRILPLAVASLAHSRSSRKRICAIESACSLPPPTVVGRPAISGALGGSCRLLLLPTRLTAAGAALQGCTLSFRGRRGWREECLVSRSRHAQCRSEAKDGSGDRSGETARRVSIPCGSIGLGLQCICERGRGLDRSWFVSSSATQKKGSGSATVAVERGRAGFSAGMSWVRTGTPRWHAHVQRMCMHVPWRFVICTPSRSTSHTSAAAIGEGSCPSGRAGRDGGFPGAGKGQRCDEEDRGPGPTERTGTEVTFPFVMNGQFMQDTSTAVRRGCIHLHPAGYRLYPLPRNVQGCVVTMVDESTRIDGWRQQHTESRPEHVASPNNNHSSAGSSPQADAQRYLSEHSNQKKKKKMKEKGVELGSVVIRKGRGKYTGIARLAGQTRKEADPGVSRPCLQPNASKQTHPSHAPDRKRPLIVHT